MTRKKVLAAWLTEAIALCAEHQPLLLFFHGSSDTDTTEYHDQRNDDLRDSASDALKDLVLVSHVTVRVAPPPTVSWPKRCLCKTHDLTQFSQLVRAASGRESGNLSSGYFLNLEVKAGGSCVR